MAKKGQYKANAKPESKRKRAYNEKTKKERAARNKARRRAERDGQVKKGDGKHVDHKKPLRNGGGNSKSNTRVRSAKSNRADNGSYKGMARKGKRK